MDRKINLNPLIKVSSVTWFDGNILENITNIIVKKDDNYFYIQDELEKIKDVSAMPIYIKEDWLKYNIKDLNMFVINRHIEEINKKIDTLITHMYIKENEEILDLLKSIRRDFIINGII
jgi:hypothetical protein